jgi:hypothetical protein
MHVNRHRRTSQRLRIGSRAALPCQILDLPAARGLVNAEILDLSERGVGVRLPRFACLELERGERLVLRSTLPGTAWSMRRFAQIANWRDGGPGHLVVGLGWCDGAPQGPLYGYLQRWRFEAYLERLRRGAVSRAQVSSSDLLALLDQRIEGERRSISEWMRGSAVALETLCGASERARPGSPTRPLPWHEQVFELLDPRHPGRPCRGRVLERTQCGFDALLSVASFPQALIGRELWALHRDLKPGQRRRLSVVPLLARKACDGLWRVEFVVQRANSGAAAPEIASERPPAAARAG